MIETENKGYFKPVDQSQFFISFNELEFFKIYFDNEQKRPLDTHILTIRECNVQTLIKTETVIRCHKFCKMLYPHFQHKLFTAFHYLLQYLQSQHLMSMLLTHCLGLTVIKYIGCIFVTFLVQGRLAKYILFLE